MAMVVKNNMTAVNTLNILNKNSSALSKSLQKVSSGMKINSAADDASGYAISERMRVQIRSLDQANQNTQNGSSMMKVAEGAVSSTVEILKTLKEKAINAANDSNTDSDRQTIQKELDQSIDQINDNANVTFNGKYLVDGSKNSKGNATYTVLTNQSLATDTTASTDLTALKARNGDSLEIVDTDFVTVSYVQAGNTYSTTFSAKGAKLQDIFTHAENIDEKSKIFADASNASVAKSAGLADTDAAITAMETANNDLYGATTQPDYTVAVGAAGSAEALINAKAGGAAKDIDDDVTVDVVKAIGAYNFDVKAAGQADKMIDVSALKDYMTVDSAEDGTGKAGTTLTAATVLDKAAFMKALSSDANYESMLNYTGTKYTATLKGKVTTADTTYDDYVTKKTAFDNAHTAVISSATVGIDAAGDKVDTASGEKGISITANGAGIGGQISGLNISITDSKGNVKKSANAALDAFSETIRAQNKSDDNAISLQVGANANQSIKVGLTDMRAEALGLKGADGTTLNISTQNKANAAINVLDNAIAKALDQQTTIGSVESRLEYTSSNLTTASENVQASESTIRDADMAKEMTNYTKNNVLLQAAQSMLAQANQSSSNVLSLLQ
ncbi:MAG: flagellin [Anaerovibrio sp.]